jgi:hypothetical protein
MGYAAQPFAIDIQKVKNVFGSNDKALLDKVKKSKRYQVYANQQEDGLYDRCLEDIIFNYIKPAERKETRKFFGLVKLASATGLNESAHVYILRYFRDKLKVCIDNDVQWLAFTH